MNDDQKDPEFTHFDTLMASLAWFVGSLAVFAFLAVLAGFIWARWSA